MRWRLHAASERQPLPVSAAYHDCRSPVWLRPSWAQILTFIHDCPFACGLDRAERDKRRGKQGTADDQGELFSTAPHSGLFSRVCRATISRHFHAGLHLHVAPSSLLITPLFVCWFPSLSCVSQPAYPLVSAGCASCLPSASRLSAPPFGLVGNSFLLSLSLSFCPGPHRLAPNSAPLRCLSV